MPYRVKHAKDQITQAKCSKCSSTRLMLQRGSLTCTNCGEVIYKPTRSKYGAIHTVSKDGMKHNSKFEANVADELRLRKLAKDIKDYDTEYKVFIDLYDADGIIKLIVKHKVDFRIHHNDGSFELYEVKGVEMDDWKWRRRLLELFWLPQHKDHIYTVRKR